MENIKKNNIEYLTLDDMNKIINRVISLCDDEQVRIINIKEDDGTIHIEELRNE